MTNIGTREEQGNACNSSKMTRQKLEDNHLTSWWSIIHMAHNHRKFFQQPDKVNGIEFSGWWILVQRMPVQWIWPANLHDHTRSHLISSQNYSRLQIFMKTMVVMLVLNTSSVWLVETVIITFKRWETSKKALLRAGTLTVVLIGSNAALRTT